MWYLVGLVLLLVASPARVDAQGTEGASTSRASATLFAHGLVPAQLMLRSSYYLYLDAGADASNQIEPNAEEPGSAQGNGEVATSESNLEEPVSSPAPGTEVPDIETLSQRAIEHHDIKYATRSGREGGTGGRSRGAKAGIAVGVIVGVGLVGVAIGAAVAMSNFDIEF